MSTQCIIIAISSHGFKWKPSHDVIYGIILVCRSYVNFSSLLYTYILSTYNFFVLKHIKTYTSYLNTVLLSRVTIKIIAFYLSLINVKVFT